MNRKLRDERDESDLRRVRPGPAHMIRPPTFVPVSRVSAARNPHSHQPSFASYPLLYRLPVHGHVIHPSQSPYTTRSDHASPAVNHVSTPPRHAPSAVYQLSPTVNGPGAVHVGYRAKATSSMTSDKNAGIATSFSADSRRAHASPLAGSWCVLSLCKYLFGVWAPLISAVVLHVYVLVLYKL